MRLTDLNREGGIGSNSLLLEMGPFRVVVDAGLSPKLAGREALPDFACLGRAPVDLAVLTHCHLDHLGSLPVLMREHPEAMLVMSAASKLLARRLLHNSHNVMLRQREELGVAEYPLFTRSEIERLGEKILPMGLGHTRFFRSANGESLSLTLHASGHVPGAAGLTFEHRHRRIFITGDVQFENQRTVPGARFPRDPVDTLILETTRGTTERQASRADEIKRLVRTVRETLRAGGSVLIPTFAFGRMQEVLTILDEARRAGDLPLTPVYVSGLGIDLCECFDEIVRQVGGVQFRKHLLKELKARPMPDGLRPNKLPKEPSIYVVSSGMVVENTPAYLVAAGLAGNPHNAICFVGYCDPDTPGGKLLVTPRDKPIVFGGVGHSTRLSCQMEKFDLSSHADREELLEFALAVCPRAVVLTHGDAPARAWFAEQLRNADPRMKIIDPVPGQPVEV